MKTNISYKDVFLYSPYDNRYDCGEITFEEFLEEIRIIPKDFKDWLQNIKRMLTPGDYFKHIIVLHGYSGCGKTTFLEWCRASLKEDGIIIKIINPVFSGTGLKVGKDLIEASIIARTVSNLKDKVLFNKILEKHDCFTLDPEIFTSKQIEEIGKIINLCNELTELPEALVHDFTKSLNFKQKLILFIVSSILKEIPFKRTSDSLIFCFDNLDEIVLEYLTEEMWNDILDVSSTINGMLKCMQIENFSFKDNVGFITVFREANFAVSSTSQLSNRIRPIYEITEKFVFPELGKQIFVNRQQFCEKHISYQNEISDLLKIIAYEPITEDIILPMFNYDCRKLAQTCIELTTPKTISGVNHFLFNTSEKQYKSFSHELTYGKRGILINAFIRYLSKNNYLKILSPVRKLNKNVAYCNKARLILTVFSNMSYPNGFPIERNELREISPLQFNLLQGFEEVSEIVTPDEFILYLEEFFNLEKTGWAHLVTIYGKTPKIVNETSKYEFTEEVEILKKFKQRKELSKAEYKMITETYVQLNASGYVYLRYLIVHFEFISAYKTRKDTNNWHLEKPLFYQTGVDIQNVKWEFEIKINEVLRHVDAYCQNMLNNFNQVFRFKLHYDESRFCKSKFVFKEEIEQSHTKTISDYHFGFYATRLISSHINYIETFRHYLLQNKSIFDDIQLDEAIKSKFLNHSSTQVYLINIIIKYLDINEKFNDPSASFIEPMKKIANEILVNKNYQEWIKK